MRSHTRIRLIHVEREAEGYLELGLSGHALGTIERFLSRQGRREDLSSHALYLWGEALRSLERYAEAIEPLSLAATIAPGSVHVQLALGWCHKRLARIDLAIRDLERAVRHGNGDPLAYYNLACYLSLNGEKYRALKALRHALAREPGYRELIEGETDFDPIRHDPDFVALVGVEA